MPGVIVIFKMIFRVESFLEKVTLESRNQRRIKDLESFASLHQKTTKKQTEKRERKTTEKDLN